MLKLCLVVSFLSPMLAGCVSSSSDVPTSSGPAYMQRNIGAPSRQTDMFGNSLRR